MNICKYIFRKGYLYPFLFFSLIFLFNYSSAQDDNSLNVSYKADSIFYDVQEKTISFTGNVFIKYGNYTLKADTMFYDTVKELIFTRGESVFSDDNEEFIGKNMVLNINNTAGILYDVETEDSKGKFTGEVVERDSLGNLVIYNGIYTTCTDENPHYYFKSKTMYLIPDDKLIARPVVLYFGNVPSFAIPNYIFTIKSGRHSGLTNVNIGVQNTGTEGRYLKNFGYYWAVNDYLDTKNSADFMEKKGWLFKHRTNYNLRYRFSGNLTAHYGVYKFEEQDRKSENWRLNFEHNHKISPYTKLSADVTAFSDSRIYTDNDDINEQLDKYIKSSVRFTSTKGNKSFTMKFYRKEDIDAEKTLIQYPVYSFSLSRIPVITEDYFSFSTNYSASGDIKYDENSDNVNTNKMTHSFSFDGSSALFKKNLTLNFGTDYREIIYYADENGQFYRNSYLSNMGVSLNTQIFGLANLNILNLKAVRHIVSPSISYRYTPDFYFRGYKYSIEKSSEYADTLGLFSPPNHSHTVNFSLGNQWQLKYVNSSGKEAKNNNFLSFNLSTALDLINLQEDKEAFSDLSMSSVMNPGDFSLFGIKTDFSLNFSGSYSFERKKMNNMKLSYDVGFGILPGLFGGEDEDSSTVKINPSDIREDRDSGFRKKTSLSLNINQRYTKNFIYDTETKTANLTMSLSHNLTENWYITYSNYYDIIEKRTTLQKASIVRDLHCWEAKFTWSRQGSQWRYDLLINIKKLPDFKFERSGDND